MKSILLFSLLFCCQLVKAQSNQPFNLHMQAFLNGDVVNVMNPLDTGFVDVCMDDTLVYVVTPDFYNSLENTGSGYSQDVNTNIDFSWTIDGDTYLNNDTIVFIPSSANGLPNAFRLRERLHNNSNALSARPIILMQ